MRLSRLLLIPVLLLILNCKKDDEKNPNVSENQIEGNSYTITYYYDKDKDETSDFVGYVFEFGADNVLKVTKNGTIITGSWNIDSSDDSVSDFIINLGSALPLSELNDDWNIVEISDTVVKLKDESGSGGIETLTLTKVQ